MDAAEVRQNSLIIKKDSYKTAAEIKEALQKKFPTLPEVFHTSASILVESGPSITGVKVNENIDFYCEYIIDILHDEQLNNVPNGELAFVATYAEADNIMVSTIGAVMPEFELPPGTFLSSEIGTA